MFCVQQYVCAHDEYMSLVMTVLAVAS